MIYDKIFYEEIEEEYEGGGERDKLLCEIKKLRFFIRMMVIFFIIICYFEFLKFWCIMLL